MTDLRSLIGKPWAIPCDPPNTFECWELVRHVRALFGIQTPSVVDADKRSLMNTRIIANPPADWQRLNEPTPYCVVLLGHKHVGVWIGDNQVLHTERNTGARVDHISVLRQLFPVRYLEAPNA